MEGPTKVNRYELLQPLYRGVRKKGGVMEEMKGEKGEELNKRKRGGG